MRKESDTKEDRRQYRERRQRPCESRGHRKVEDQDNTRRRRHKLYETKERIRGRRGQRRQAPYETIHEGGEKDHTKQGYTKRRWGRCPLAIQKENADN